MAKAASSNFRTDIEGLRGLAIALVVVFHVFVGKVSAGVDVFLLLGGIFFFGSQLSNAQRKNGLTFFQSLLRIIRRLFPLLAVVVAATLAGSLFVMNKLTHVTMAEDARAALGYFINWQLAFSGREYTSVRNTVSPFQHLWSMSAQLQIYVASLLVVVLIAFIFRKFARPVLLVVLSAATLLSFGYAAYLNVDYQALNYYSTASRFWEIGLGGLLGMLLLRKGKDGRSMVPPMGRVLRWVLGIVGLAAIICTGIFLDGAQQFPGPWTLVPLLGAAMVVLAGTGGQPVGVTRLLETRLFQFLGRISYALYLWHWPILVLVVAYLGTSESAENAAEATDPGVSGTSVDPLVGIGVMAVSVVLAWISSKIIEKPLRQGAKPARSWVLISPRYWWNSVRVWPKTAYAVVIAALAAAVVVSPPTLEQKSQENTADLLNAAENRELYPGGLAFLENKPAPEGMPIVPPLEDFRALLPPTQPDGCQIGFEPAVVITHKEYNRSEEECAYGDLNSDRTLYVIGGSHSEHFIPAMDIAGRQMGLKIKPLLKMGCPVGSTIPLYTGEDYPSCREWSGYVMDYILENPPTEGVFMTGTRPTDYMGKGPEVVPTEYVDVVKRFDEAGIRSYLVRDNVWHVRHDGSGQQLDMRRCVSEMLDGTYDGNGDPVNDGSSFEGAADPEHPTSDEIRQINEVCGTPVEAALQEVSPQYEAYKGLNVQHLDFTNLYCKDGWCPAIIGNMAAYRDAHHFTNVFAETFAGEIVRQMQADPPFGPIPVEPLDEFPEIPGAVEGGAVPGTALDDTTGAAGNPSEDAAGAPAAPGASDPAAPAPGRALGALDPSVWETLEQGDPAGGEGAADGQGAAGGEGAGEPAGGAAGGAAGQDPAAPAPAPADQAPAAPAPAPAPQPAPVPAAPVSPVGPLQPYWDPSVGKYYDPNTGTYL